MKNKFISKKYLRNIFTIIIFFPFFVWCQEKSTKSIKDGFAIHLGAGIMYGGNIGFLIEKQIHLKEKVRVSPFLAFGFAEGAAESISNKKYYWFGISSGVNMEYGKKHRIIFGSHFEVNNLFGNSSEVKKNFFVGVSSILGYRGTNNFGLIWQVYIGDFYSPDDDPFSENIKYENRSQVGIGIGYKF